MVGHEQHIFLFVFCAVNCDEYLAKEESQIPVDEVFFYRLVEASSKYKRLLLKSKVTLFSSTLMCHSGTLKSAMQRNGGKGQTERKTMRVWRTLTMMNLIGLLVGPEIKTIQHYTFDLPVVINLTEILSPQMLLKETAFSRSSRMMTWTLQGMFRRFTLLIQRRKHNQMDNQK